MVVIVLKMQVYGHLIAEGLYVFSVIMVVFIITRDMHPSYKLAWVIPILFVPLFGGMFYLLFGTHAFRRKKLVENVAPYIEPEEVRPQDPEDFQALQDESLDASLQAQFIRNVSISPVYQHTETEYYPSGETFFEALKDDLRKAKKYVFLEFFIVEKGVMLNEILDILEERAKAGVDVRLMYDDLGSSARVSTKFPQELEARGIHVQPFNARGMKLSFVLNNRDHRKIVVIDGCVSYTGGANLADEYINARTYYGHWKDSFVRLEGAASWSFAIIFLQMWGFASSTREPSLVPFMPVCDDQAVFKNDGFVIPYADSSPINGIPVFKYSIINAIQDAKESIYIMTPYLILDSETQTALKVAAEMGLDVRIMTPGVPDKKYVYEVTRANYQSLLESGVRIFEYSPGFLHSKNMLVDDSLAIVGTCNLDYRSFFLHFECGAWMYESKAVYQLRNDFDETFEVCREVTLDEMAQVSVAHRLGRSVLSAFAPLM